MNILIDAMGEYYKRILAAHIVAVISLSIFIWNAGCHMYKRQMIESLEEDLVKQKIIVREVSRVALGRELDIDDCIRVNIKLTSYNPVPSQGWGTGLETKSGRLPMPNIVAVSHDLKSKFNLKYGDKVIIDGYGVFIVDDLMNKRFTNRVDIISFIPIWSKKFGVRSAVLMIPKVRRS